MPTADLKLSAANSTAINTFGRRRLSLDLNLRRVFDWSFIIADVARPILGADFLSHFGLIVDLSAKTLIDPTTNLTSSGKISRTQIPNLSVLLNSSIDLRIQNLLKQFQEITIDSGFSKPVKHLVTHSIITTD